MKPHRRPAPTPSLAELEEIAEEARWEAACRAAVVPLAASALPDGPRPLPPMPRGPSPAPNRSGVPFTNKEIGKAGLERGARAEEDVVKIALALRAEYPWLLGARRGTKEEDPKGIDVVVHTIAGDLWLQVKTKMSHASVFRSRQRDGRYHPCIRVVVMRAAEWSTVIERVRRAILDAPRAPSSGA